MIGEVRDYKGQRYEAIEAFDRTRRDGTVATILIWQSGCADCGDPFRFTVPATASKFMPNRRCQRHKRPGHRVRAKAAEC